MNKWIKCMRIFFLFYKKKQCPINFDRQLGISHFKIQHGIKLCITSLYIFVKRWTFCQIFINMPRALSVSLFSPAWLCQFWSTTPLGVTLPVTAHITPPLQLDKVNTAITPNCPEVPALSTVQIPRLEQALLCHCLPTPIRPFFFCLGNLAPTPWVDQITLLKSEFKSFFCPSPSPSPTQSILFPPSFHYFLQHHPLLPPLTPTPPKKSTPRKKRDSARRQLAVSN